VGQGADDGHALLFADGHLRRFAPGDVFDVQ
jgi:hypothetical protein